MYCIEKALKLLLYCLLLPLTSLLADRESEKRQKKEEEQEEAQAYKSTFSKNSWHGGRARKLCREQNEK